MAGLISLAAAAHPIKAVTIFTSRKAEIVRTFVVNLTVGQNELVITGLPSCIDTDSARVTGLDDAVLFDVICTVADARDEDAKPTAHDELLKTLERLRRRRDVLRNEKALRDRAADALIQYSLSLKAENAPVDVVSSLMGSVVTQGSTTFQEIVSLDEEIAEAEKKLEKEKRRLEKERLKAPTLGRVSTVIMAKRAGKIEVILTYMVSNVEWFPTYDLRATTEEGKPLNTVSFHYRASIKQNTGEDWRDTAISVSTASPRGWTSIPPLRSLKIVPSFSNGKAKFKFIVPSEQTQNFSTRFTFGTDKAPQNTNTNPTSDFNAFEKIIADVKARKSKINLDFSQSPPAPSTSSSPFGSAAAPSIGPSSSPPTAQPLFTLTDPFGFSVPTKGGRLTEPVPTAARSTPSSSSSPFNSTAQATPSTSSFSSAQNGTAPGASGPPRSTSSPPSDSSDGRTPVENPVLNTAASEKEPAWAGTEAVVTEDTVASVFRIEGKCTIPSEPTAHKVVIATLSLEAEVSYIAVPRSAPLAFLECNVKNTSEYRLLSGPVNVFLDNNPASKTSIEDVGPGEVFKCTLGPDPSLRIKCTRLPPVIISPVSAFAPQTTVTTYKICTHVHNTHSFAINNLFVRDAAPAQAQSNENGGTPGINVVVTADALVFMSQSGKSTVKVRWAGGAHDRGGEYVWVVDVGAGEEVKLEAEYEVRAPPDYKWMLRETPI